MYNLFNSTDRTKDVQCICQTLTKSSKSGIREGKCLALFPFYNKCKAKGNGTSKPVFIKCQKHFPTVHRATARLIDWPGRYISRCCLVADLILSDNKHQEISMSN